MQSTQQKGLVFKIAAGVFMGIMAAVLVYKTPGWIEQHENEQREREWLDRKLALERITPDEFVNRCGKLIKDESFRENEYADGKFKTGDKLQTRNVSVVLTNSLGKKDEVTAEFWNDADAGEQPRWRLTTVNSWKVYDDDGFRAIITVWPCVEKASSESSGLPATGKPLTEKSDVKPAVASEGTLPTQGATPSQSNWHVDTSTDSIDGAKTTVLACGDGDERIIIRFRGNRLEAYVTTPEIVDNEDAPVRIRFDDGKPISQQWSRSEDYTAVFAPDPRWLLAKLQRSKKFYIEYHPYQKVPETLSFDVAGLVVPSALLDAHPSAPVGKGEAEVYSWPGGANVSVDGEAVDGVTPMTVTDLRSGSHRIEISKAGYQTQTVTVAVKLGETGRVEVTLVKQ